MKTRRERLTEVFEYVYNNCHIHNKTEFAEAVRITRPAMSSAMNGNEKYLTDSLFQKICAAFPGKFNLQYLLTGEGELTVENEVFMEEVKKMDAILHPTANADSQTGQIIALYKKMYDEKNAELKRALQDKEWLQHRMEELEDTVTFLKNLLSQQENNELLKNNPFPVGVADKKHQISETIKP